MIFKRHDHQRASPRQRLRRAQMVNEADRGQQKKRTVSETNDRAWQSVLIINAGNRGYFDTAANRSDFKSAVKR